MRGKDEGCLRKKEIPRSRKKASLRSKLARPNEIFAGSGLATCDLHNTRKHRVEGRGVPRASPWLWGKHRTVPLKL